MVVRLVLGLLIIVVSLAIAGRRIVFLARLIRSGQPAPGRLDGAGARLRTQLVEVFGQERLLKWSVPGVAHFITFWAFVVLGATIVEAVGALFNPDFAFPIIGHTRALGFLEDLFGTLLLLSLLTFALIRRRNAPQRLQRSSRFYGSHTRAAWLVLFMITMVVVTLFLYRGPQINTGHYPWADHPHWTFTSWLVAKALAPLGTGVNAFLETFFILAQIAVVFGFLVLVVYSKHLHIFLAPVNVSTKRNPDGVALGGLPPMMSKGKVLDFEQADPETDTFGVGKVEDFTWKAMLDMATCTECGRCQSQCPAWNTGKPLSPKLLIMDLRDHLFAKAPYMLGSRTVPEGHVSEIIEDESGHHVPEAGYPRIEGTRPEQATRPLVGTAAEGGVIDPDVLWSCTTCGACVEQCPVDIEHVDHILDMRRYQVLIESAFPSEAGVMLRNLENKGNPWGLNNTAREDWTEGLPFEVRRVTDSIPSDVEYLFWVGCAGALEDRAKKVTRAFAELLHTAGVEFAILGSGESCTGDPARRLGNEFVFQMLGQQNVELLNGVGAGREHDVKIVATCPHCFNTLANEYPQLGGHYDVVHHTQLLGKLVADGHLVPVTPIDEKITYHDPCYLGRHNRVYTPPREILDAIAGFTTTEMPRCKERGFCCGAGGARMWMEEKIGKRINVERTDEALATDADLISTACPFCIVMLSDAVTAKKQDGSAKESVQVLDVSQILARSLVAPKVPAMAGGAPDVTPDVVDKGPAGPTPAATEAADTVQLAQEEGTPRLDGPTGPGKSDG
ncbi:MAG: CoB--CoM heterodisulfide reductase [Frankiales bacterium]|nr:CoB--CoM heterodisulfide reductase [Frankiales bacterium]